MESVLWESDGFNRSATTANSGMFPPHEVLFGPPADAGFAVLQAGVPSRSAAKKNGPPGAAVFFREL